MLWVWTVVGQCRRRQLCKFPCGYQRSDRQWRHRHFILNNLSGEFLSLRFEIFSYYQSSPNLFSIVFFFIPIPPNRLFKRFILSFSGYQLEFVNGTFPECDVHLPLCVSFLNPDVPPCTFMRVWMYSRGLVIPSFQSPSRSHLSICDPYHEEYPDDVTPNCRRSVLSLVFTVLLQQKPNGIFSWIFCGRR